MEDLICYCFNYTALDIEMDVLQNGRSTIMGPGTSQFPIAPPLLALSPV